jgi:hypothetical protein
MSPNQPLPQQQQVEDAARQLSTLLKTASVEQLLQHPPPAVPTTHQQDLLDTCWFAVSMLQTVLPEDHGCGQVGRKKPTLAVDSFAGILQNYMKPAIAACRQRSFITQNQLLQVAVEP